MTMANPFYEFFREPLRARGNEARLLFDMACKRVMDAFDQYRSYIETTLGYSAEYMVPLMAWMLHDGRQWGVVDIGTAYGIFPTMCGLAGWEAVGTNPVGFPRSEDLPWTMVWANLQDPMATDDIWLPMGPDALYNCTEVVEHQLQNPLIGLRGMMVPRNPGYCFFGTSLAGTVDCPEFKHWREYPDWDGEYAGSVDHCSGWDRESLADLVQALGFELVLKAGINTCCTQVPEARVIAMGRRTGE